MQLTYPTTFSFAQVNNKFINNRNILRKPFVVFLILLHNLVKARSVNVVSSTVLSNWWEPTSQQYTSQALWCKTQVSDCTESTVALNRK